MAFRFQADMAATRESEGMALGVCKYASTRGAGEVLRCLVAVVGVKAYFKQLSLSTYNSR